MTDSQIADMFAAQTAIIHLLVEKLIKADVINRDDLMKDLYELLDKQAALYAGPVLHADLLRFGTLFGSLRGLSRSHQSFAITTPALV